MIFRRSLVRELTATAVGMFIVLLAILFTNLVLRLLGRAAGGSVAVEGILPLLGFNALFYFNILLSVALYMTVLLTLSRWHRDSEMIVWFTSGQGLTAWLKPILLFAAPFLAAILVLSLFLSPWAERRKLEYERQLQSKDEIALLTPGLFREFRSGKLVAFVESINTFDGTIRNIFLHTTDDGKDVTIVAKSGTLEMAANGDRFLALSSGRLVETTPGTAEARVLEFERLARRIEPAEVRALPLSRRAIPTEMLLAADGNFERGEIFWRVSIPLSALVLTVLAIPLAYVNPRVGRSFNLLSGVFLYMLYSNTLNVVQTLIAQGKVNFWVGLALPHLVAVAVVMLLFSNQLSVLGLVRNPFARRAAS